MKTPLLLWLDLETTGLDPLDGLILEVAAVATDLRLNELASGECVVRQDREAVLARVDDYVLKMHLGSGLLEKVWGNSNDNRTLGGAEQMVFNTILDGMAAAQPAEGYLTQDQFTIYLAGSSVHFDRQWLAVHMREVVKRLHYRLLDVSAYKVGFPGLLKQPGGPAHRAMDDVRYSIDQHRQMRAIVASALEEK